MDLSTKYLGLELKNPLVAGASPLSRDVGKVRQLEDAGVAAVVMYSVFQEQIEHEEAAMEHYAMASSETSAEALSYFPAPDEYCRGPVEYLAHLSDLKKAVDIPVIASLNCTSPGGWVNYATKMQEAGADAIELNIYQIGADPSMDAAAIEDRHVEIVSSVKKALKIPVAVKLAPYFSALTNFAKRLDAAGADGLVLFNRFYQPDIDLDASEVVPEITFSAPHEMRLPLRWIAVLDAVLDASLAATTGVYTSRDVLKLLTAGADVTQLCAVLLKEGPSAATKMLEEMTKWLAAHEYEGVRQLQGSMNQENSPEPSAFERGQYMRALTAYA